MQATLAQYPILSDQILANIYNRLVQDGYITFISFENQVREEALLSQKREGLQNPFAQEAQHVWEKRLRRIRNQMIAQFCAKNYTIEEFEKIVDGVVQGNNEPKPSTVMWHNLQTATVETIFEQALAIEHMSAVERKQYEAQLLGAKVALIKKIICDRLPYIETAKNAFSIQDLIEIYRLRIGRGKIGGKAAGVLLADRILKSSADADIRAAVATTESFFIGADEYYSFISINNLLLWYDQKYKDEETQRKEFPQLEADFARGSFSSEMVSSLERVLQDIDGNPFIVRSSSLLEDNYSLPFNGMYESVFISNQGNPEENLKELENAIRKIYASTFSPNALAYRQKNGLLDFEEKMAILIQVIPGASHGNYYFTDISGFGSSVSPYKWKQGNDRKDEGLLRFTLGLGTQATRRYGADFTQMVDLSEPDVRHSSFTRGEAVLAQENIDVFNLRTNQAETLEIQDVIDSSYPPFFWIAQHFNDGKAYSIQRGADTDNFHITFNDLVRKTNFTQLMRDILQLLARVYGRPVLIEFTAAIDMSIPGDPSFKIQIHKCRPTGIPSGITGMYLPPTEPVKRELLTSDLFVENGLIENIEYVVFIDPERYHKLLTRDRHEICAILAEINRRLADRTFVFAAASRWGCMENHGIPVTYRDVSNAKAMIELSGWAPNYISDPFVGTQFFQNITEAGMYSIITDVDRPENVDHSFFNDSHDLAAEWLEIPEKYVGIVRILQTKDWYGSKSLRIEMNRAAGIIRAEFV